MNGLALRVSTVKGNENLKKNSELRLEVLDPPGTTRFLKEFDEFVDAKSVETQINAIRQIGQNLKNTNNEDHIKVIESLALIYFYSPIKHGVRNIIVKIYDQLPAHNQIIVQTIRTVILDSVKTAGDSQPLIVTRIAACLENFKHGVAAVEQCLLELFRFTRAALSVYVEKIQLVVSPAEKNQLATDIHNAVRFVIACLHYFLTKCTGDEALKSEISAMDVICGRLMENRDLPMDTKTNSGIFAILKCKIFDENLQDLLAGAVKTPEKRLCLCFGIISSLDRSFFEVPGAFEKIIEVATILEQIGVEFAVEPTFALGVCRAYVQLSKKLLTLKPNAALVAGHVREYLQICFRFSLTNLEHNFMDSVRHLSQDLLINIVKLSKKYDVTFLDDIFSHARLETPDNVNVQCMVLTALAVLSLREVITRMPDVVPNLLALIELEHAHVSKAYETLMGTHFNEVGVDIWTQYWVKPLVFALNGESCPEKQHILEVLLRKAVKISPTIVFDIVQFQKSNNSHVMLACLGDAKKVGMFDAAESNDMMWKCVLSFGNIRQAMVAEQDETRVAALRLITESHRSTERTTAMELDCVLFFLRYNISAQSPSLRQSLMSAMRNLLLRIAAGLQSAFNKAPETVAAHDYTKFLLRLQSFCIDNLFIGANFSRRTLSLKLLLSVCQTLADVRQNEGVWMANHVEMLINCLEDSYEANVQMCMDVLKFVPKPLLADTRITVKLISTLAVSVKPADSVTAAYYLEFLTTVYPNEDNFVANGFKLSEQSTEIFKALIWCVGLLEDGLRIAQVSLIRAARENPLYGLVFCIRHLLTKVQLTEICQCDAWREFFVRLVTLSKSLCAVMNPVVNNSSPEGHLPNDFGDIGQHLEGGNGFSDDTLETTPQMVLLSAWRTVKEVSLLLGDMVFRSPMIRDHTSMDTTLPKKDGVITGLLSSSQILDIFNFFTKLLSETKHRGAFEQAYIGFSRICIRLWGATDPVLHQLPFRWLRDLIKLISGELDEADCQLISMEKICVTRRSAGVPYMIQALITSELQICASTGLHFCMTNLIGLCRTARTPEARTHALNILRALYRCTDLGETIGEYVADGLMAAITGYGATSWSERNSSTLLFSALMVRIFGVQRTKEPELNIRNKMTGRIFFLRYPQLYDFFLDELRVASAEVLADKKSLKLHPILLLLSRLYPSSLEGTESNLKLIEFLPIVSSCSGSAELQTRHLAAKFIEVIIAPHMIVDRISNILRCIVASPSNTNLNSMHGALLQILYCLRSSKAETISTEEPQIFNELTSVHQHLRDNPILYETFLDIYMELLTRNYDHLLTARPHLQIELADLIAAIETSLKRQIIGQPQILRKLAALKFIGRALFDQTKLVGHFLVASTADHSYEYLDTVLNICLLIIDYDTMQATGRDLEIAETEFQVVSRLFDATTMASVRSDLLGSAKLPVLMKDIIEKDVYHFCTIKAYTISSYSMDCLRAVGGSQPHLDMVRSFVDKSMHQVGQLEAAIFKCVARLVQNTTEFSRLSLKLFFDMAAPEADEDLRLITSDMLSVVSNYWLDECLDFDFFVEYGHLTLTLLRDDSVEVREMCSKTVVRLCQKFQQTKVASDTSVIAMYAQENFVRLLIDVMLKKQFTIVQIGSLVLIMVGLLENCGECADEEYQVFDKSEANVYGETYITEKLCIDEFRHVLRMNNIDNLNPTQQTEVCELTKQYCPKSRFEYVQSIVATFQQP